MGKFSRDKGNRVERFLVQKFQEHGFGAERVPLSGAAGGRFGSDLSVPLLGIDRRVEVKVRATGFTQLYDWLEGSDFLIVKADHREPLAVVPMKLALEIATVAEKTRHLRPHDLWDVIFNGDPTSPTPPEKMVLEMQKRLGPVPNKIRHRWAR